MIKVFISHSSAQKPFVEELAAHLGLDSVIVDKYDFEGGRLLLEEIKKTIGNSNLFVLLLSEEGLDSRWIKTEISEVRDYIDENKIYFMPFIIDENIQPSDDRIKAWIRNSLIQTSSNSVMLSRTIRRKIQEIVWEKDPSVELKSRIFVGRDKEISEMYRKLYENTEQIRRAIIVSGLPHIGRKRLLIEFLRTKLQNNNLVSYSPLSVRLSDTDSIEEFIKQLNDYAKLYSLDLLYEIMSAGRDRCVVLAVELINNIADYHERILINDNGSIVLSNGSISDWFTAIVLNKEIIKRVSMLIASRYAVAPSCRSAVPEIQSTAINSLTRPDIVALFNAYASALSVRCEKESVEKYLDSIAAGYPEQVFAIVDTIKDYGESVVHQELPRIQRMYDEDLRELFDLMKTNTLAMQTLILMSRFEFVTIDILCEILDFNVYEALLEIRKNGLMDVFGSSGQYLRVDQSLADYLLRSKIPLEKKYENKLSVFSKKLVEETDLNSLDLAADLFRLKKMIEDPRIVVDTRFLLPSVALKVIIDEYRKRNYPNVIVIADSILNGYKRKNFESVLYSIHYWLCLSLCKTKDSRLLDEVKYFDKYPYWFLKGFYFRNKEQYVLALDCYDKALRYTYDKRARYLSKSEHEITLVKMKMGDFGGALDLAKRSYDTFNWNSFHIAAYFRCYVRSRDREVGELDRLLEEIEKSHDPHKEIVLDTMRMEKAFYCEKDPAKAASIFDSILKSNQDSFVGYAVDAYRQICKDNESMELFSALLRKNKKIRYNENAIYDESEKQ